jgi:hypothetical protein
VAVVLTPVQTKQIRINIHKRNKNPVQEIENSKYMHTYYKSNQILQKRPHVINPIHYKAHTYTHITKPKQTNKTNTYIKNNTQTDT